VAAMAQVDHRDHRFLCIKLAYLFYFFDGMEKSVGRSGQCLSTCPEEIIQNCFQANKPVYLVSTKPSTADSDDDEKDADKVHRNKRLKKEKDGQVADREKEWLVTRNYHKIFHKEVNKSTPPFNSAGDIMCNKWHLQGYCFEKCECKSTH